jgi:hypothetical protein
MEPSEMIILNEKWRVSHDGRSKPYGSYELQWRHGDKWDAKSFCQHKFALLSAIHNKAGVCDPAAMEQVNVLPDRAY